MWADQPSATACGGGGAIARSATTEGGGTIAHSRAAPISAGFMGNRLWTTGDMGLEAGVLMTMYRKLAEPGPPGKAGLTDVTKKSAPKVQPHLELPQFRQVAQPSICTTAWVLHLLHSCAPAGKPSPGSTATAPWLAS